MLLSRQGSVLLVMLSLVLSLVVLGLVVLLLVQPGRISLRVLVLVREDVLSLSLEHGDGWGRGSIDRSVLGEIEGILSKSKRVATDRRLPAL